MPSWCLLIGVIGCTILSQGNGQTALLSMSANDVCVGDRLTLVCEQNGTFSGVGDIISFHKDGNEGVAECTVDLTKACSPTFPSGSSCGCVSDSGGVKRHEFVIPSATKGEAASYMCLRRGFPSSATVRSESIIPTVYAGARPENASLSLTFDGATRTLSCSGPTSLGDAFLEIKPRDTGETLAVGNNSTLTLTVEAPSVSGTVAYVCSLAGSGARCSGVTTDGVYTVPADRTNCSTINSSSVVSTSPSSPTDLPDPGGLGDNSSSGTPPDENSTAQTPLVPPLTSFSPSPDNSTVNHSLTGGVVGGCVGVFGLMVVVSVVIIIVTRKRNADKSRGEFECTSPGDRIQGSQGKK